MIKLSERLKSIFDLVPECDSVADVGCDHGYLSIALIQSKRAKHAFAMDINKGPLQKAAKHIKEAGLETSIETRLSDGLAKLEPFEAQCICICGMGGKLMARILSNDLDVMKSCTSLILEPQSEYVELRKFLQEQDFIIDAEDMACEENKYYPIIRAHMKADNEQAMKQSPVELKYGPCLTKEGHPLLVQAAKKDEAELNRLFNELTARFSDEENQSEAIKTRIDELSNDLKLARSVLGE